MEHETLFTASKWQILKQLEKEERSPLELAKICNTSVANVSQQLRLLEMAGLVTSRRVSNRDKDKPRILYSLTGNLSYLIAASDSFVEKKLLRLTDYNKIVMRIWFFEKPELQYLIEKAFWKLEDNIDKISFLAFNKVNFSPITFYYIPMGKLAIKPFTVTDKDGSTKQIVFETKLPSSNHMHVLYDSTGKSDSKKRIRGDEQ